MEKKEYKMKIESFKDWNSPEELAFEIFKEELEVADQLRDITAEYQDMGIDFEFDINCNHNNKIHRFYSAKNLKEWKFISKNRHLLIRSEATQKNIFNDPNRNVIIEIILSGIIPRKYLKELEKSIRSYFPEWKFKLYAVNKSVGDHPTPYIEIELSKLDIGHKIGSFIR